MSDPERIALDPASPSLELAAQLVAALQAELPAGVSQSGLLAAALTMARNGFSRHTRRKLPQTYLDGFAASTCTEIRGIAEAVMADCGLPAKAAPFAVDRVAVNLMQCIERGLDVAPEGSVRAPRPGPSREAG